MDTDASIIHRHCIIQPGSLSAKLPGLYTLGPGHGALGTGCIIHHPSASAHHHPLLSSKGEDNSTFPGWQPFKKCVLRCLLASLSPIRYHKIVIIFKESQTDGFIVSIPFWDLDVRVMWQLCIRQVENFKIGISLNIEIRRLETGIKF